jgi:hypothetical protein
MKYIVIIILFFSALALQGQGQNKLVTIIDEFDEALITFKALNQKIDTTLLVDGSVRYLFEFPGSNTPKTKGRFILQWIPISDPPVELIYIDNLANVVINSQLVNIYTPASAWTLGNTTGHYNSTIQFSNVLNSTLVTKFTGKQIQWIGEKDSHLGIAAISIDNGTETLVDQYSATNQKQVVLYTSPILSLGLHTVKLRVTRTRNVLNTKDYYVVHDAFKVTP